MMHCTDCRWRESAPLFQARCLNPVIVGAAGGEELAPLTREARDTTCGDEAVLFQPRVIAAAPRSAPCYSSFIAGVVLGAGVVLLWWWSSGGA